MKKVYIKRFVLIVLLLSVAFLPSLFNKPVNSQIEEDVDVAFENDSFGSGLSDPGVVVEDFVTMSSLYTVIESGRNASLSDAQITLNITNLVGSKRVSISTADELYQFGNAQSINFNRQGETNTVILEQTIKKVLSLNYVLLADIDYSVKKSQKFVPVGTNISLAAGEVSDEQIEYYFPFTGTFDGNKFEIKNLYLAEYSYVTTTFQDDEATTAITVALFKQYAMFSTIGTGAVIKNLILRNPILEIMTMDASSGLFQTAMLAGENRGEITNVAVIDEKINNIGQPSAGIILDVLYPGSETYTAAGFVYDNKGNINNSYLVSNRVVAGSTEYRFTEIAPFVYSNTGTITNSMHNEDIVKKEYDDVYSGLTPVDRTNLKENVGVTINGGYAAGNEAWYFYEDDGYPQLKGLKYVNGEYQISNEYDLIIFGYLLNLTTEVNGSPFDSHHYVLTNHINMKNIINYQTPSREFKGLLYGGNTDFVLNGTTNANRYIYNLKLSNPYVRGNNYHLGLFSRLSGTVRNVNFYNNSVIVNNSNSHYGKTIHVGMVAAELINGTIKNIVTNSTINLGNQALGLTYAGGIVGLGSGIISYVTNTGLVEGGKHDFRTYTIIPRFYVGGIIGTNNNPITISYTFNKGNVKGVGTTGTTVSYNAAPGTTVRSYTGGIIGEVNNNTSSGSSLVYLTNNGLIESNDFRGKDNNLKAEMFVGGIFGSVSGFGFKLSDGSNVRNGRLENKGNVKGSYLNENSKLFAAGIGVANTTETKANISYLTNNGGYEFSNFNYKTHNRYMYYASTIIDNSDNGIKLSRAYNDKSYIINQQYFDATATNISEPTEILLSFFFVSTKNASSELLYVENSGDLTVGETEVNTTVTRLLKISNITQATRTDYKNVINSGDITVLRINNSSNSIYVAGVSFVLAYDGKAYTMNSVVNEGKIITTGILGNTTFNGTPSGMGFNNVDFSGNLNVRNLYVAGIVNLNAGLITNSFNLGDITSYYDSNTNRNAIKGTANTFVGGINTFNYNLIQNVANSGLINYTNDSTSAKTYFAGVNWSSQNQTNNSIFGGITISYIGGITIGGIVSALGDVSGTEVSPHAKNFIEEAPVAQVIDSINNGDVFGKAREYVRSGGILGTALSIELSAGTYENKSSGTITAGPFTTASIGKEDPIGQSLLSNGLNYGAISSISQIIGSYDGTTQSGYRESSITTVANALRPGINASAGGVIAYGLTKMVRMINHGTISSTDVAGGIVGATYILGTRGEELSIITTVTINTAVHYGRVKAARNNRYSNIEYSNNETYGTTNYYPDNDTTFIYQDRNVSGLDYQRYPNRKRGFGGIFGRMQRGRRGTMASTEYKNIMNMDSNIDMVGRVDSNISNSLVFYRFYNGNDSYYSAKENDTTSYALVGWNNSITITNIIEKSYITLNIRRYRQNNNNPFTYTINGVATFSNVMGRQEQDIIRIVKNAEDNNESLSTASEKRTYYYASQTATITYSSVSLSTFGLEVSDVSSLFTGTNNDLTRSFTLGEYEGHEIILNSTSYTGGSISGPGTNSGLRFNVPRVSEQDKVSGTQYIFDPNFPLMQPENSEYIYPVAQDALASRFQNNGENPKPNGMYVLSSSTGSADGAALPTNISISNMFRLDETDFEFIDINNVPSSKLIENTSLISSYNEMKQLNYNDKSEILPVEEDDTPLIADLELYDPSGNSPTLSGGEIDPDDNSKITFNVSSEAFSQDIFNYQILSNQLSNNAIIAVNNLANLTEQEYLDFREDYLNRENDLLPVNSLFIPTYTGNISTGSATFIIRVYSEIFALDKNIYDLNKYYKDYEVTISRGSTSIQTNTTITVDENSEVFNNMASNVSLTNQMNPSGTLTAVFNNTNSTLPEGHKLTIEGLYLIDGSNETKIDEQFYTLVNNPKVDESLSFEISLRDKLQAGEYQIKYKYYNTSETRTITFNKSASNNRDVIDVDYEYFSNDSLGNVLDFVASGGNIKTYIKFGYLFEEVTTANQTLTITPVTYQVQFGYIDNLNYYKVSLNGEHILELKLAPFASIDLNGDNEISYTYDNVTGLKSYVLTYFVKPEEGTTYTAVTHTIEERNVDERLISLDDNLISNNHADDTPVPIAREIILAALNIDYNFLELDINNLITASLGGTPLVEYNNDVEALAAKAIAYVIKESNEYFTVKLTDKLSKGLHELDLVINREGEEYNLRTINIEILEGVSAYLTDIRFTRGEEDEIIFEYPSIKPADANGVVYEGENIPDSRVYYGGIDYAGADDGLYTNFKIEGRVSDIILESYKPNFSAPAGATIERFDTETNSWTTDLEADFIGLGIDEEIPEIIKYQITSEDGNQVVTYFISLRDIRYNLTLKLRIYYYDPLTGLIEAANINSPIKNEVVLVSLKNLELVEGTFETTGPTVNDFPTITYDDIIGFNNQASLYYYLNPLSNITYRFGRNMSGAYNFTVVTPKYKGTTSEHLTLNERYHYQMYMIPRDMSEGEGWFINDYKLPNMTQEGYTGVYYHVTSPSQNPIIRELAVVVLSQTRDQKWGLYDDYATWD